MDIVEAVNIVLRGRGQSTVNSIEDEDQASQAAQSLIARTAREILKEGYPFNTDEIDLTTDINDRVPISKTFFRIYIPDFLSFRIHTDGIRYLWHLSDNDFYDTDLDDVRVVFDVPFADITEAFQWWITRKSAAEAWADDNPDQQSGHRLLEGRALEAKVNAVKTIPGGNINRASGWNQIARTGSGTVAVRHGHHWVWIG